MSLAVRMSCMNNIISDLYTLDYFDFYVTMEILMQMLRNIYAPYYDKYRKKVGCHSIISLLKIVENVFVAQN